MLATLTERAFSHPGWVFERKFDGVRCLVFRDANGARLMSRNRKNLNAAFPELAEAFDRIASADFIVDGEIVAFDGPVTSFGLLQRRLGIIDPARARLRSVPVHLYLFDILHAGGYDLTGAPLLERKAALQQVIPFDDVIRYSEHRFERGEAFLQQACRDGWEGLIAKKADSPYRHLRSREWLKLKCVREQEFVVGGYTKPQGSRTGFGALLVGHYDRDGRLRFAGKVGTGFDEETLRLLAAHLRGIERDSPAFSEARVLERDRSVRGAHWVEPQLVAQVGFTEWTSDGRLRHPRFLGLRTDKPPRKVVRE